MRCPRTAIALLVISRGMGETLHATCPVKDVEDERETGERGLYALHVRVPRRETVIPCTIAGKQAHYDGALLVVQRNNATGSDPRV